jgi:Xaa-Pro aminopeptidase
VVAVDRAYLAASQAGATLGEAFRAGEQAYTAAGYYGDWEEHHQGGITGYAGREVFATEDSDTTIDSGTVLAWNPTVPGAKSEDTVLLSGGGHELLTRNPAPAWPWLDETGDEALLPRAGIKSL